MVRIMQKRRCPQWVVFNGVKGQTSEIVKSDRLISIKGSNCCWVKGKSNNGARARHNKRVLPWLN